MPNEKIIGIDIGGTSTRIASSERTRLPLIETKKAFLTADNFDENLDNITTTLRDLNAPIDGIGIGIPGNLNVEKTRVVFANNVPGYVNVPLVEELQDRFNCEVIMDSDAKVAALGIGFYGNAEKTDFAYVTWGTGVGGAMVSYPDNKPTASSIPWAENFGSWEETCGGKKIQEKYRKNAEQFTEEEWNEIFGAFETEIVSFKDKLQPEKIIFGGGISAKKHSRLNGLLEKMKQQDPQLPSLEISSLGEDAGVYGAFGLLQR